MKRELIRQGDVLFIPIAKLPGGERTKRENGTVAYGEVTGHSHTLMSADTAVVLEIGDAVYVAVSERGVSIQGDCDRIQAACDAILVDPEETELRKSRAQSLAAALPTAGALFLHGGETEQLERPVPAKEEDRHFPVALQPGIYGPRLQREYSPEAIRSVRD